MARYRLPGLPGRMIGRRLIPHPAASPPPRAPEPEVLPMPDQPTIPADWRKLSWPERRRLAASVSETPIRNGADAERAILAALKEAGHG